MWNTILAPNLVFRFALSRGLAILLSPCSCLVGSGDKHPGETRFKDISIASREAMAVVLGCRSSQFVNINVNESASASMR